MNPTVQNHPYLRLYIRAIFVLVSLFRLLFLRDAFQADGENKGVSGWGHS